MKKLTLMIFMVMFSALFIYHATACDPGWYEYSTPVIFPGCPNLIVQFCVHCNSSSRTMEVKIKSFDNICDATYLTDYIDAAQATIGENYAEFCTFNWVHCPDQSFVTISTPLCWNQDPDNLSHFLSCNDSYCIKNWWICTDDNGIVHMLPTGPPWTAGTINCPYFYWPNVPPFQCFRIVYCR